MGVKVKSPVGTIAGLLWVVVTTLFFFGLSVLILAQPDFPLKLGIFQTVGRSGLWVTLLPALTGLLGLVCWRRKRLGPVLVTGYSAFWFLTLLSGLPYVWNAKQSFCVKSLNFCITTPWLGRAMVLAVAAPFLLTTIWAVKRGQLIDRAG
jgi:hypothetical protein